MTYEDIKYMQDAYTLLQESDDLNEANTQSKLVVPFLLKSGFKESWLFYEDPLVKGKAIADITVKKNGEIIMIVEVKKVSSSNKIDTKDLLQLSNYLHSKESRELEWGILTNGKDYLLVNNKITGEYFDKEVIRYSIFDEVYNQEILDYFSYNNLFENKYSYFRKYLKQYEVIKLKEKTNNYNSWTRYNDTIENYFKYIKSKFGYRDIKHLSEQDFIDFNKADILASQSNQTGKKPINSIKTIVNRYSHIRNFYELFLKNGLVNENPFGFPISDSDLSKIYGLSWNPEIEPLTHEEIECILKGYGETREPERNRIMFLICLSGAAMVEDLANLKTNDIDFEKRTIKFSDRILVFPQEFIDRIENTIRNRKFNSDYLFARKRKGYSEKPIENSSINDMIQKANGYLASMPNSRNKQINPEKMKAMSAKMYFEAGFSIDEIVYLTGMSLNSLSAHISTEDITKRTQVNLLDERHPYKELFKEINLKIQLRHDPHSMINQISFFIP